MRTLLVALAALVLYGCSTSTSALDEPANAPIRKAAQEYLQSSDKHFAKNHSLEAPDMSFRIDATRESSLVDIVRKQYGDLETAIVIYRIDSKLDCSSMSREQWASLIRDAKEQQFSLFQNQGALVTVDDGSQTATLSGHDALSAVLHESGWKIYHADPYFPSHEAETAFNTERDSLLAYYKKSLE